MADYHKMWADLGMDVEKHEMLLQALPELFQQVYLMQAQRPQGMQYFNAVTADIHGVRPAELVEHRKQGGKVFGTFCVYVPDEIIFAAGGVATGLCGGSQFWVPGGETVLPQNTCSLIKASIGARFDKTCPFFRIPDLFIGETTCDGKKKAWEILAQDAPVYVMDLPQMKRRQDTEAWESEIRLLLNKVEQVTGNLITPELLASSIKLINNKRRALARLYNTRKNSPVPISGLDSLLISQIAFYDDPARFTLQVNALCDELEDHVQKGRGGIKADAPRILITGTPMAIPNWKLHHIVESSGGVVVVEELCTGVKYFENLVDESATTLEGQIRALANRYMKTNCACFTPNPGRLEDIMRLAKEYKADGIIDYTLQFCGLYSTESYLVQNTCKEAGLPFLHIETDYSEQDSEQIRTRVQAFLEMIG